jgi:hypothetical protein
MTTSKNKGSGAISDKEKPPLPTPTTARKQVQRKYYIMRGVSFQALPEYERKGRFYAKCYRRTVLQQYPLGKQKLQSKCPVG